MLALPGSLLWLCLLVYCTYGQILDKASLDNTNSSQKLDDFVEAANHTSIRNHEEEKENIDGELPLKEENIKLNLPDTNPLNLFPKNASQTDPELPSDISQESNPTTRDSSGRNKKRITSRTGNRSRTSEPPMMSQERRNSYLSIAERRKYYNRTRVQTKKPQLNEVELEYQETTNKLVTSSTETSLANEIRVIKKPAIKDFNSEIISEKNQTSNRKPSVHFPNNETQGKLQSINTRQSVIQSQYQFGQKINLRKPTSRTQETQEEKSKRKKEKSKMESIMENSTNKLNKNYPTQSTKLIRVDKNVWATTRIPQADADNKNFVTHSHGNATVLEKLVGYIISNDTKIDAISNKEAATSDEHNIDTESNNQTKVPLNSFNPLPLNNLNVTVNRTFLKNASAERENISSAVEQVYNQEILKVSNLVFKTEKGKQKLVEDSNMFNPGGSFNNSQTENYRFVNFTTESPVGFFINSTTFKIPTSVKTTDKVIFKTSTTSGKNRKLPNFQVTQPTILKSNLKGASHDGRPKPVPVVKAISRDSSSLSRTRFNQSEVNASNKQVSAVETKEKGKIDSSGVENWTKTEDYPLTIELNENNKRVLSEMFQTLSAPKPKIADKDEANASQAKLQDSNKNETATDNSTTSLASKLPILPPQATVGPISTSSTTITTTTTTITTTTTTTSESPQVMPPDDHQEEDHKAQGTRYNTKFYISPKFNSTQVIKVVEEDDDSDDDGDVQGRSASVAIYVLAAFGLVPLLLALIFGAKFMMQRNQRAYECESDEKSDVSANESQIKDSKKKKGSTDLKKSPSNVTTITLVTATRLPRVQHWENSEKQGNRNWEFPRSNLKLKTILGQGNFGQVWKAEAEDMPGHEGVTRLVAVKTVKEGATEKEHTEFIKELEIMQQIGSHPNIVTLLGCCTDQEPYYLIMEYVKYGKLLTYLREHRVNENYYNFSNNSDALTSRDLTVFAYCVARGMEYLASRGIIHRDLAARNVLVDHNKLCKIADFGMSRSVRDFENGQVYEERQQKGALPIRWMAPESLVYSVFTYKSDVWSFGIVMWEIVTLGSTPYPNMGAREVMRKVRDGYRLERPSHCKPEFYRLISYCWTHDPNKRPDFSELRHELSNLLDNPTKDGSYVDLDRFAVDNSFHVSSKTNDFRLLERNDFTTLQKLGDWENKDWPEDVKKIRTKRGRNNGKGTVTLTGQGSFTVNSRILEKEFKII